MIPDILNLLRLPAFQPFFVVSTDGERHLVRSRDRAFVFPSKEQILVVDDRRQWALLAEAHISQVRRATEEEVRAAAQ